MWDVAELAERFGVRESAIRRRQIERAASVHRRWTSIRSVKLCGSSAKGCHHDQLELWTYEPEPPDVRAQYEVYERDHVDVCLSEDTASVDEVRYCKNRLCVRCGGVRKANEQAALASAVARWVGDSPGWTAEHEAAWDRGELRPVLGGRTVLFLTLTMRHCGTDRLCDLLKAQRSTWSSMTESRAWKEGLRDYGIRGYANGLDLTWSAGNGWHPHRHILLFADRELDEEAFDGLEREIFAAWAGGLESRGWTRPRRERCRLERVRDLGRVAAYLGRCVGVGADVRALAGEVGALGKTSKHAGHYTLPQIFAAASRRLPQGPGASGRRRRIVLMRERALAVEDAYRRARTTSYGGVVRSLRKQALAELEILKQVERPWAVALPRWVYDQWRQEGWVSLALDVVEQRERSGAAVLAELCHGLYLDCDVRRPALVDSKGRYWCEQRHLPPKELRSALAAAILLEAMTRCGLRGPPSLVAAVKSAM